MPLNPTKTAQHTTAMGGLLSARMLLKNVRARLRCHLPLGFPVDQDRSWHSQDERQVTALNGRVSYGDAASFSRSWALHRSDGSARHHDADDAPGTEWLAAVVILEGQRPMASFQVSGSKNLDVEWVTEDVIRFQITPGATNTLLLTQLSDVSDGRTLYRAAYRYR